MSYKIYPSAKFKPGVCSITQITSKEQNELFCNGEGIEVDDKAKVIINKLGWCDGNRTIRVKAKDRDTTTE